MNTHMQIGKIVHSKDNLKLVVHQLQLDKHKLKQQVEYFLGKLKRNNRKKLMNNYDYVDYKFILLFLIKIYIPNTLNKVLNQRVK